METFIALSVLGLICWVAFRYGKQLGSRKGFWAGRMRARR